MRTLVVLVAILSAVAAQICDTCQNPLFELSAYIDVCQTGGIYRYTAADFNLMSLGYSGSVNGQVRSMSGGDVEGRVFANGDLMLLPATNPPSGPGYSIGDKIVNNPSNAPYAVKAYSAVIGGNVMWTNGQLNPVNNDSNHIIENGVYFGGASNAPNWLRFSQCNSGNPLDISTFRQAVQDLSTTLHTDVATATYTVQNNGQTIVLNGGGSSVCNYLLRINASDWNNHKDFLIVPNTWNIGANVVIDVNCDASPFVFLDGEFPALATNVLYNFGPECEGIEIQARSVTGSILAPWSSLNQADGRIWGNVYVGEVMNFLQINEIPCSSNPQACDCCNLCFAKGKSASSMCKGDILLNHKGK